MSPEIKSNTVARVWINVPQNTSEDVTARVQKAVAFLAENKVRFTLRYADRNQTGLTGFFNSYKKGAKDPDVVMKVTQASGQRATQPAAALTDEIPF